MFHPFLTSLKECISHGDLGKAFRAFSLIQFHFTAHDQILEPIYSLLIACSKHKSLQQGRQLHSQIICLGLDQHSLLLPKLVTLYSTFNLLPEAHLIAEKSSVLDPLVWNILISAYVRNGLSNKALCTYRQMLNFGIRPDEFTYPSVLKACGEQLDLGFGKEVHSSILVSNYGESICVRNALISMYGKCGDVGVARVLFDNLPNKDGYSWNSMISGYSSKGMWEEAFVLFEKMRLEDVELNIITWNTIIGGCLRTGNYVRALDLVSQMRTCAVKLDAVSMASGLSACSHIGSIKTGKEMHAFIIRGGCANFLNVQNALITMYAWCQDHRHAHVIFQQMEEKDIISWNSIISGYAHYGKYEEASFLFREMLLCGFRPNYVTVASILPLCAREANLQHGKELHCFIIKRQDFSEYLLLWNALVEMYAKTSRISEAQTVFNFLTRKDIVTYTSLITGYGILGDGEVALKLFEEMNSSGIKPDLISLVAVLSACSHSGLVIQGQLLFEKMWCVYGIRPCLEHYACMVDLFGRAGLLKKAEEIIRTMPFEPSADMWATLIGACQIHRNIDLGEWAAEKLLALRPRNPGYYVLIANMYAAASCWDKLARVRTYMRDLGLLKSPGCAWVDLGSGFEPFLVGDSSMELSHEIYPILEGLTENMKDAGYFDVFVIDYEGFEE
ncbi:pentatricopeptide repeat-containing protein At1g71490-like [Chenopodium quinoa]|uniref:pentatricopeptide repeat-containing protein At1g71490-like n=1 Tax=Chenopodium quinoa TaxID=63459 RepID=UPI000B77E063|nr:pentatricopeptide repeat-containing protein At1g71490-like [Chenopodium quinoa]